LTYTDGDRCHHINASRSAVIVFVCAAGGDAEPTTSFGQPHFVNEDDCTYKFTWPTPLACRHSVWCVLISDIVMACMVAQAFVWASSQSNGRSQISTPTTSKLFNPILI